MSKLADNILELYEKGMSEDEIMETTGCSLAFLNQTVGKQKKPTNQTIWTEDRIREWKRLTGIVRRAFEGGAEVPRCYIEVGIRLGIRDQKGRLYG